MSGDEARMEERIDELRDELDRVASASGYHLNPDSEMTRTLVRGLLINQDRVGYMSCPCRMPVGSRERDLDIICPCDYRDADLADWGACYCALYVTEDVLNGKRGVQSIPERRPPREKRPLDGKRRASVGDASDLKVWRCRVCGYLCAREGPPERCPICKVSRDRFEEFRNP
ncbi:MAG: ferredoxin:glutaredoxin reductase [Candidatus Eisenbacteria bacterium]|nr:ferredoxin:glutaredoxin reductase [Candidatus Eisenbacteria bacterium]